MRKMTLWAILAVMFSLVLVIAGCGGGGGGGGGGSIGFASVSSSGGGDFKYTLGGNFEGTWWLRFGDFQAKPPNAGQDVATGDSRMYGALGKVSMLKQSSTASLEELVAAYFASKIYNGGVSSQVTYGCKATLNILLKNAPKRVFVNIGVNDILQSFTIPMPWYEDCIAQAKATGAEVWIMAIYPTDGVYKYLNSSIEKANEKLRALADEEQVKYFAMNFIGADGKEIEDKSRLYLDGLHFNETGGALWITQWMKAVYPEYTVMLDGISGELKKSTSPEEYAAKLAVVRSIIAQASDSEGYEVTLQKIKDALSGVGGRV